MRTESVRKRINSGMPKRAPSVSTGPLLENGDALTQEEFHRRYVASPDLRAELIEGIVFMSSPVKVNFHGVPHLELSTLLGVYMASTVGVRAFLDSTVILDKANEVQPDAAMVIRSSHGGRVDDPADYVQYAPELVVEISSSSVSKDMNKKFQAYLRNNAQEYLIYRVRDKAVDWFSLDEKSYKPISRDKNGIIKSGQFPGLWLNVPALINHDLSAVLNTLNIGLASPEHAAFRARLQAAAKKKKR